MDEIIIGEMAGDIEGKGAILGGGLVGNGGNGHGRVIHVVHGEREGVAHALPVRVGRRDDDVIATDKRIIRGSREYSGLGIEAEPSGQCRAAFEGGGVG